MKNRSKILLVIFFMTLSILASKLTFSYVLGSHAMKFSGINFLLPLLGAFFGITVSSTALGVIFALKFFCTKLCITLGIPTALATLSWTINTKTHTNPTKHFAKIADFFLHVIFPLTCMMLFIMHPIAGNAYAYSLYWLIPVTLFFVQKNIFLQALQSTFIAHAMGSIMVLYSHNLQAAQWVSLIPVVIVERLVMASGMTLCLLAIKHVTKLVHIFFSPVQIFTRTQIR